MQENNLELLCKLFPQGFIMLIPGKINTDGRHVKIVRAIHPEDKDFKLLGNIISGMISYAKTRGDWDDFKYLSEFNPN
jgi:hypothetical protein